MQIRAQKSFIKQTRVLSSRLTTCLWYAVNFESDFFNSQNKNSLLEYLIRRDENDKSDCFR